MITYQGTIYERNFSYPFEVWDPIDGVGPADIVAMERAEPVNRPAEYSNESVARIATDSGSSVFRTGGGASVR